MPWLDEVADLKAERDHWKATAEARAGYMQENVRLREQVSYWEGTGWEAEVERLRTNIDIWQKTAEDALDEVERLRAIVKSKVEGKRLLREEVERLRDKLKYANLYLENYRVMFESARFRADYWKKRVPWWRR